MIGGERLSSLESMLAGDHVRLDRAFQAIVTRAYGGDYQQLEGEWVTFERALQQHLDAEERTLIPALAQDRPGEARVLLEEHARMRVTVLQLGVELELHCLRAERVESFLDALRAHALREENVFYPWVDRQLGA